MSDTTASDLSPLWDDTRPAPAPKAHWPLMGDIVSARAGLPELLIQWHRATGDTDPPPDR